MVFIHSVRRKVSVKYMKTAVYPGSFDPATYGLSLIHIQMCIRDRHKTGAAFSTGHIPPGCANAIYLHYVIRYNAKNPAAAERYAEIARRMGLEGTCQQALINSLCEKIDEFNVRLNIPKTLKDFGIQEEEFKEKVAKIAELAVGDACTGSNPRAIDPANMEKLLTCTYYGTEVDF